MTDNAQIIEILKLRTDISEFIGADDKYIALQTILLTNCIKIAPPAISVDHVAIFDEAKQAWTFTEDHRSSTVYDMYSGASTVIDSLGPQPENMVTVSPSGQYEKWDGKSWIKDEEIEKNALLAEATARQS